MYLPTNNFTQKVSQSIPTCCSVDKVSIQLTATSKLVATATWLVKVTPYNINMVKQDDCALRATAVSYWHFHSYSF